MIGQEHQVCLLLGSNIQPETNLPRGVELLRQKVKVLCVSSVWETPSVGSEGPDFFNAALLIRTSLNPDELKDKVLRPLEAQLGRVRSADKNAPRPIDFDIIIFDGKLMDPGLWQHAHRAVPVAEILPDYRSGRGEILSEVASELAKLTSIRMIFRMPTDCSESPA
jgi:2-amino-4-hydroxy-6-hydroxymethyldihydropteridine diphosphokinase